jgi:ABC-type transport system involved in multi-copper enzyme maturation permease subunit
MLSKIRIIAYYTFFEILKSKVLINVLILGAIQFVLTYVAYSFTYGEPSRVALDFGLGTLTLSSIGIAIFMGVGLLSDEIENRTVYMIISRPVPRSHFILGRLLGLTSILIVNIAILSIISLSLFFIVGGEFQSLILWSILYIFFEAILVLVIVSLLSMISSKTITVIVSILLYVLGHAIDAAKLIGFVQRRPYLESILDIYHFILPGFYKLNLKEYVLYKQSIDLNYLYSTSGYVILYILALVFLILFVFNRKDLD